MKGLVTMCKRLQEVKWKGNFGDAYTERNGDATEDVGSEISFFEEALSATRDCCDGYDIKSCLEIGAGSGRNLVALTSIIPDCVCSAVEINPIATQRLQKIPELAVFEGSILDYSTEDLCKEGKYSLVLSAGVLIHIHPNLLPAVYELMYQCSDKYLLVSEYYNPTPVEVKYRGERGLLFKRDFAGDLLDTYSDLELIDYGFRYHRDLFHPMDDLTYFLLKKRGA